MKSAILNAGAGILIAFILSTGYSVINKFGQLAETSSVVQKDDRVVLGHRIDSMGNFQIVYKTN